MDRIRLFSSHGLSGILHILPRTPLSVSGLRTGTALALFRWGEASLKDLANRCAQEQHIYEGFAHCGFWHQADVS